ncbi:UNKNOWN [Stylonychia lemnae]|uniref:Uncharacterized protein n=1 Tax=Stylonychia lemnae TaxID=5949 RepID=A0A078A8L7_STYLE|nr:UNKNOWN [Stylonychia lemnae]|eukprot:CDW77136.1 UNKNOWN [Stylonychia lemnae]
MRQSNGKPPLLPMTQVIKQQKKALLTKMNDDFMQRYNKDFRSNQFQEQQLLMEKKRREQEKKLLSIQIANEVKKFENEMLQSYAFKKGLASNNMDSEAISAPQKYLLKRKIDLDKSEIHSQIVDKDKHRQRMKEYLTEDSEYEDEAVIKLQNQKIIYDIVANKKEVIKYLVAQKLIKSENIEKLNQQLETAGDSIESLLPLDQFITSHKEIEFFLSKYFERLNLQKKKEYDAERKERDRLRQLKLRTAQYSRYKIINERSVHSKDYLTIGDIAEKDPLYVITSPEEEELYNYYQEIPIDAETFAKLNAAGKTFILKFIKENCQPKVQIQKRQFKRSKSRLNQNDTPSIVNRDDRQSSVGSESNTHRTITSRRSYKSNKSKKSVDGKDSQRDINDLVTAIGRKKNDENIVNVKWKGHSDPSEEKGLLNQRYFKPLYEYPRDEKKQIHQWMDHLKSGKLGLDKSPEDKRKIKELKKSMIDIHENITKKKNQEINSNRRSLYQTPTIKSETPLKLLNQTPKIENSTTTKKKNIQAPTKKEPKIITKNKIPESNLIKLNFRSIKTSQSPLSKLIDKNEL